MQPPAAWFCGDFSVVMKIGTHLLVHFVLRFGVSKYLENRDLKAENCVLG